MEAVALFTVIVASTIVYFVLVQKSKLKSKPIIKKGEKAKVLAVLGSGFIKYGSSSNGYRWSYEGDDEFSGSTGRFKV